MNIRFRALLTVAINHPYYPRGCRDFGFLVPPATRDALRGGKLIARERDGALHVLFEAREDGTRFADLPGHRLVFGLRLGNPHFGNVTDPVIADRELTPLYVNSAATGSLDPPLRVQLVSRLYAHAPQEAARPVTLTLADENGRAVATRLLATPGPAPAFDLRALPSGLWTVDEDYGGGLTHSRRLLLDPDLVSAGAWGVIAIRVDDGFYAAPAKFAIDFVARRETLDYYVVAPKFGDAEFGQLAVADAGFAEAGRAEVKFRKVLQPAFTPAELSPSLLGSPPDRVVLFRSLAPVARTGNGLRRIQLERNGEVLIEHLPQPSAQHLKSQFVIHLSKP